MTKMLGLDVIVLDAKTGDVVAWPTSSAVSAPVIYDLAATFLPGMPPEEIEKAYGAYLQADVPPSRPAFPTTAGSVIRHSAYGYLVLDDEGFWGSYGRAIPPEYLTASTMTAMRHTFEVMFDAPVAP